MYSTFLISLSLVLILGIFQTSLSQDMSSKDVNTFTDQKTGISFQYPLDWQIASDEYTQLMLGDSSGAIVLLPQSLDGSSLMIIEEVLPFSISSEKYYDLTRKNLEASEIFVSDAVTTSIGPLNAFKYNVTSGNEYSKDSSVQTQIVFSKDSKGFVIAYTPSNIDPRKDLLDIKTIIDSFKIETKNMIPVK